MRKYETRRSRELRIKRQKRSNAIAMILAIAVVFVLSIVIWNGKQQLVKKNNEYESRIEELHEDLEVQQEKSTSLEEYKKYVQTKKFVVEVAREIFGLVYPDEIIYTPVTNN